MGKVHFGKGNTVQQQIKYKEIIKYIEVPIEKIITIEKPIEIIKEVIIEKPIVVTKIELVEVPIEKTVEKIVKVVDITAVLNEREKIIKIKKKLKRSYIALTCMIILTSMIGAFCVN